MILLSTEASSQTRFNIREVADFSAVTFKGVIELEDGYGVTCNGVHPTDSGNMIPLTFVKFNLLGEYLTKEMYFRDSGYNLMTNESGFRYLNDEFEFCCVGYKEDFESDIPYEGFIASFNELGDTTFNFFSSPYLEDVNSWVIAPIGFCKSTNNDNSIFISSNILEPESGTGGDFYIQRMAPDGEVLWEYIYATDAQPEYCNALLPTPEGGVLGVLREWGNGNKFIELDDSGEVVTLNEVDLLNRVNDLVWYDMDTFIGVGLGEAVDVQPTGLIFRMDLQGDTLWTNAIGEGFQLDFQNQFHKVVKSLDESGYVAGGTKKEFLPEEEQTDSTGTTISQGWLVKVDEDGTVLWDRTYHYINTPYEEHTLNDLKATSDGGYIFCGESRDADSGQPFSEGPAQQGWLVKVDEYGCLVEDCQLTDEINVIEQEGATEYFKAGPIPAEQFLNIYQSVTAHLSTYQLFNSQGQLMEEFPALSKGATMILDVSKYSAGSYQLVLREGDRVLQSEKIIKE